MSGDHNTRRPRLVAELIHEHAALDRGAKTVLNASARMFRTAKYGFYLATLGFSTYLIELADVEPLLAMTFAALLIAGPEAVESWLISVGEVQARQARQTPSDDGDDEA